MSLLQAGVNTTVIALWLGHADVRSTQPYLHADLTIKERALALVAPTTITPVRYKHRTPRLPSSKRCDYADNPISETITKPIESGPFTAAHTACRHSRGVGLVDHQVVERPVHLLATEQPGSPGHELVAAAGEIAISLEFSISPCLDS